MSKQTATPNINSNENAWSAHPIVSAVIWLIGGNVEAQPKLPSSPNKEKGLSWKDEQVGGKIAEYMSDKFSLQSNDFPPSKPERNGRKLEKKESITRFVSKVRRTEVSLT